MISLTFTVYQQTKTMLAKLFFIHGSIYRNVPYMETLPYSDREPDVLPYLDISIFICNQYKETYPYMVNTRLDLLAYMETYPSIEGFPCTSTVS